MPTMPDPKTYATAGTNPDALTPRERFIAALERRPLPGRVPHFELVFFLTMEAFGRVHPSQRQYRQWLQMTQAERASHRRDLAELYVNTAERYGHDAIFLHPADGIQDVGEVVELIAAVRDLSGDRFFLMMHGDPTFAIPDGENMEALSLQMVEEPEEVEAEARWRVEAALDQAQQLKCRSSLDGFALCSDYCFNSGSFLPLPWFDRFVTPYLHQIVRAYKEMGFYVIKHTDGNIMPILDRLVPDDETVRPHALHSLDPQGGVDIADLVDRVGDRVALCGNVNCGLMQTGTDAETLASAEYAIEHGLRAPGYVFCTSNCVYTGMELSRYELILDVWRRKAIRPA